MQSQAALTDQLRALIDLANRAGLYDAADFIRDRAFPETMGDRKMWRVTVRTLLGAKRGEFLVESDKLQATVEGIATEFFTYDCEPER